MSERRVRAALRGERADRTPFALWTSLRHAPRTGEGFVRAALEFDEAYGPADLLKLANALLFSPASAGDFGWESARLRDLRRIGELRGANAPPMVETLPGVGEALLRHGAEGGPGDGAERLAEALTRWAEAAVSEGGCAGVFLAVAVPEWAAQDRRILAAARAAGAWCNIVHTHSPDALTGEALEFADAISGPPNVLEASPPGVCRVGGMDERRIGRRTPEAVRAEVREALDWATAQAGTGRGFILAPGCTLPPGTPPANLRAIRETLVGDLADVT